MEVKKCGRCKEVKEVSLFSKAKREKSGYQQWCKACMKNYNPEIKKAYDKNRYYTKNDEWRDSNYKRKYGISLQEYNAKLEEQNNSCAICGLACPSGRRLAVDHNHTTGKVRGLLCGPCNQAIGSLKEDKELMFKAIEYLMLHEVDGQGGFDMMSVSLNYLRKKYN